MTFLSDTAFDNGKHRAIAEAGLVEKNRNVEEYVLWPPRNRSNLYYGKVRRFSEPYKLFHFCTVKFRFGGSCHEDDLRRLSFWLFSSLSRMSGPRTLCLRKHRPMPQRRLIPQEVILPAAPPPQTHPAAVTYSHGYEVRFKIHKYASFATLPLFATELALGQSLYNGNDSGGKRAVHGAVGAGIVGLFAANTLTGVWNLWEARHDSAGKSRRTVHSILMLASDAGFVAATATAPHHERRGIVTFQDDRATHRDIAVASISVATVGYLIMLLHHH